MKPAGNRHILVIRLSALGDVALMVPVVRRYAEAYPDCRFTIAGPPLLQPLFAGKDNVEYLGLKKKQSFIKIYQTLNAVGADTVVDLHRVNRVGFALTLLRLRHLLNPHFHIHALHKGRLSRFLFLHHWRSTPRRPQYMRYEDVFRRAGLVAANPQNKEIIAGHASGGVRTVGIAPFSQHEGKIWTWENIESLVESLVQHNHTVLLFGSKEEAPQLEALAQKYPTVSSVAGKQTFAEELAIIGRLSLMVSMDSANMHFASVLGVPVVSIWGATHPDFGFYPQNQPRTNALCANLPCQPCSAFGQKACRYGDYRCLRAVTPEMVMAKIVALIPAEA